MIKSDKTIIKYLIFQNHNKLSSLFFLLYFLLPFSACFLQELFHFPFYFSQLFFLKLFFFSSSFCTLSLKTSSAVIIKKSLLMSGVSFYDFVPCFLVVRDKAHLPTAGQTEILKHFLYRSLFCTSSICHTTDHLVYHLYMLRSILLEFQQLIVPFRHLRCLEHFPDLLVPC